MTTERALQLLLLLPLAGAIVNGVVGLFVPALRKNETLVAAIGTGAVGLAFALAVGLFAGFHGEAEVVRYFTWLKAGDLTVDFAYRVDSLSLLMTLIITGIGTLIHLYSAAYMKGDGGFWRFFAYLNLFIFAMLNLVLGDNLPVLFSIGVLGVLVKRNAIVLLMSVELMLNAVNLTLVALSQSMGDVSGQVLVFFVMAVAAAEAAIGLALVIALFRRKESVDVTEINLFKF